MSHASRANVNSGFLVGIRDQGGLIEMSELAFETLHARGTHGIRLRWRATLPDLERVALTTPREAARSIEEVLRLAESYAHDADRLRDECRSFRERVEELEAVVARLKADRASLQVHLSARGRANAIAPAVESAVIAAAPVANEVRFYKKRYATPSHDVLIRVPDCGCNRWQGAHAGHKAREGIAKLEGGRMDWKTLHHCASCTGGGMWRVRW